MQSNINILPCYKEAFLSKNRYLLLYGGRGSGKSKFSAQKIIIRLLQEKGHKFLIIRKYAVNLKNSVFAELTTVISDLNLESEFDINVSPLSITCKSNKNQIIFAGLDDGEKLKSIAGITGVWIEESTQLTKEDFASIDFILRGNTLNYKQIILTFNPIDVTSWLNSDFFVNNIYQDVYIKLTTYRDNPYIRAEYEKLLDSYKNSPDYDVIANGKWGQKNDKLILTNYEIKTISKNINDYKNVKGGIDFGFNDPNVCLLVSITNDTIFVIKEYYKTNLTNEQFANNLILNNYPKDIYYTCDSARPEAIQTLKNNGFKALSVSKGKNSILKSINYLKNKKIIIDPACENTIKEIGSYQWLSDKNGNILDEVLDKNNHCMDALRYSINLELINKVARAGLRLF